MSYRYTPEEIGALNAEIEKLKSALEPFAAIGRKLNAMDEAVWPRDAKARFLNLDGLTVRHFCDAGSVLSKRPSGPSRSIPVDGPLASELQK